MSSLNLLSLDDIPMVAFIVNPLGKMTAVNQFAINFTGYTEGYLLDNSLETLLSHKNNQSLREEIVLCSSGEESHYSEQHAVLTTKYHENIKGTVKFNKIEQGFLIIFTNLVGTEHFIDDETHESAEKILNDSEVAYWQWDIVNNIVHYSAKLMLLFGYPEKPFTGPKSFWEKHVAIADVEKVSHAFNDHLSGSSSSIHLNYSLRPTGIGSDISSETNNGEINAEKNILLVGRVSEHKNNKPLKVVGFMKDLTPKEHTSTELKQQSDYLKLDEKLNQVGHWRFDVSNNELFWSPGMYLIYGVRPEKFSLDIDNWLTFYIEKDQPKVKQLLEGAIAKGKGFYFKSSIIKLRDEKVKIECLGEVEKDAQGKVIGIFGVFKDITKQEDTFEKLKLLAMVNYAIKVPIFFIDEHDNVVYQDLTPQFENKNSILFNFINFSITEYLIFKRKAKDEGQIKKTNISFDKYITVFDVSVTYEADEGIYIWIVENVTDKFRKEQQQIVSNRMALLGNTFGNVSHDINNVLGVALGAIEMLELKFSKGDQNISGYIDRVKNAIDKGKSVTERLLAFTKKPTIQVVSFDPLVDIVDNQHLFEQLLLTTIDFSYHFEGIDCLIKFPQGEFINIILNLVLNAQDAIRENSLIGKIEISANINEKEQLEIHVNDSGIGIEQENLSRIFDPFYSSKSVNKGNGIGLANVYSTIYKHNGEIRVNGHGPLGGAEFTLIFNAKILASPPVKEAENNIQLDINEVPILILDDEQSIAEFVALYLDEHGAFTKHVTNKKDLIQALDCNQHYDIFITDMILPDISGRDAVDLVLAKYPDIKIYSMSGYIGEDDNKWEHPVLRKPFNSDDLAIFLNNN